MTFDKIYEGDNTLESSDNTNLKFLKAFSELLETKSFEQI
ncbi:TPA: TetR/AcrR family transcriptional regulator, partial [Streptococcus agalactiae]